jgi:hypothetical protein
MVSDKGNILFCLGINNVSIVRVLIIVSDKGNNLLEY